jgi:hypothetical protein
MIKILKIEQILPAFSIIDNQKASSVEIVIGKCTKTEKLYTSICGKGNFKGENKVVFIPINTMISLSELTKHLLKKGKDNFFTKKEIKNKNFKLTYLDKTKIQNDGIFLNYTRCYNFLKKEYPSLNINDEAIADYIENGFFENPFLYYKQEKFNVFKKLKSFIWKK